ncbi:hypothetical protein A3D71_03415 [Candidatus Kaiserbacteria bacterium RIFCSPHIGHO2_02_FULL_55_20]|uniref:HTH arsR-type domain-containing protein n=1 Tax=Candidatus Kaiserbacteria bacterium RIFCSPHIGHO2_02_FULL_55_20 TaxID=1798497 RepID=A0A1F6DYM8_9BACT|nr:MAG: hypothetical protein A2680_03300 [Candidatus Kaiserbacteria bacterium RIFCSPHIGHO2_01_FULL_55_37]OGG66112.1 MAG: hypothetical protein A3D71_03415 [Candidatus Kaiserbacteria bacterium RIFCSPHIGHO2_02_FULL_55_20]
MTEDFLGTFMGNTNRAKVLRAFFLDQSGVFTAPLAAKRAGLSLYAAQKEVKALEKLGILKLGKFKITLGNGTNRAIEGKQKEEAWMIDPAFKHSAALSKFVHEVSPVQYSSILKGLKGAGRFIVVVLSGSFMGDPSRPADILVAADGLNEGRLETAIRALERQFGREIRYAAFSGPEFRYRLTIQDRLMRDTLDFPHLVLLDKARLL